MPRVAKRKTSKPQVQSPLMSIADGARYLKTDVTLVRKAISCGELPVFDFGSRKLYKPTLDAFIIKWQNHGDELEAKIAAMEDQKSSSLKDGDERRIYLGDE
ncbi:hypothetical protein BFD03_01165 [Limosilactobacillus reuteri]|uniref:DNA-binding protein n=1 Tax=Limosilactobacillus reuteri TaxID=1598 RepID=A0A1C2GFA4_LIMRT|nr:hypothetical protein [Limosilactobacillus reuteri]OCX50169.1 hypothetical protein BFD03_01165 [Limosilactobacillus reuteri]WPC94593.1 hypothetical protein R2J99_03925 [Limosilactobacillus reuteri]